MDAQGFNMLVGVLAMRWLMASTQGDTQTGAIHVTSVPGIHDGELSGAERRAKRIEARLAKGEAALNPFNEPTDHGALGLYRARMQYDTH